MYTVMVFGPGGNVYTEDFDAPDWQTALIAAAELAKTEPDCACDQTPCHLSDMIVDREPDSACDLDDESCPDCGEPRSEGFVCPYCERCTTVCPNMRCVREKG